MGKIAVVLSSASGAGRTESVKARVTELCRAGGHEVLVTVPPDLAALDDAVRTALDRGVQAILVGGGDGTVSRIAGLLLERDVPLGVLPLGTFNHFAKDLGIPLQLDAAMQVALAGYTERVDLGEVNGRVFLNNSSLGLYPLIVRLRQQHPVRGPARFLVALWATLREIRRHRQFAVRIRVGDQIALHRTPIVMVGNNEYRAAGPGMGTRASLHDGRLAIYIVKAGGRRHVLRLAWKMLTSRSHNELEVLHTDAATIEPSDAPVHVAVDGDVEAFAPPLEYRIRPGALRVLVPAPPA